MSGLKTIHLALPCMMALLAPPAPASNISELTLTFAGCAGRLSAQMEHQWLFSDPASERTEAHRAAMISLIEAVMPEDQGRQVLAHRIAAKQAHAQLLTRASFNQDDGDAHWALTRAEQEIATCLSLILT